MKSLEQIKAENEAAAAQAKADLRARKQMFSREEKRAYEEACDALSDALDALTDARERLFRLPKTWHSEQAHSAYLALKTQTLLAWLREIEA